MEDTFVGPGWNFIHRTENIWNLPWEDVAQVVKEPLCSVFVKSLVSSNSEVGTVLWVWKESSPRGPPGQARAFTHSFVCSAQQVTYSCWH